jgi:DNA-binding beta-propeller fold protein YncE
LGILYDGGNIWVTDSLASTLFKLDGGGAILQTVTLESRPYYPVFDGTNIWAPLVDLNAVAVVRASTGALLATLTGNGLNTPRAASFDGQRVLVTNESGSNVSLWKAADLTALGSFPMPASPDSVCSDGFNFWIGLTSASKLARF